jgi:hypothetical protein
MLERLERLADGRWDRIGRELEDSRLPRRIGK